MTVPSLFALLTVAKREKAVGTGRVTGRLHTELCRRAVLTARRQGAGIPAQRHRMCAADSEMHRRGKRSSRAERSSEMAESGALAPSCRSRFGRSSGRRSIPVWRTAVFLIAGLAAVAGFASVAAGAREPSGDAAAITFYRRVRIAYRSAHAVTGTRRGFLAYTASGTSFRYTFGEKIPPGFREATESLLYVLRNGRVVDVVDKAKAVGLPALTYIEDPSGAWAALVTRTGTCFHRNSRIAGLWGQPFVGVFGDFSPLRRSGSTVIVHSTYPWGTSGMQMREVDRIGATSKLFLSIAGRLDGPSGFTWSMLGIREVTTPSHVRAPTPRC
jgi:hypothetical protein